MAKAKSMVKTQMKKQVGKPSNIKKKFQKHKPALQTKDKLKKDVKKANYVQVQVKTEDKLASPIKTESKVAINPTKSVPELTEKIVKNAVELTFDLIKKHEEKKADKTSLLDDEVDVMLQVSCVKIPKCPLRTVRFSLPHSLVNDATEICLIVPDLKKGRKIDPEPTLIHYEDMLRAAGITNIKVLPFTQLKLEYSQFEAKRRLLSLYDVFLVDGKISGHVFHMLGKVFVKARKLPTSVRLSEKDLKNEMVKALSKTSIVLTPHGNTSVVKVGHNKMPAKHVTENILAASKWLNGNYPGGLENVETLYLKAPFTAAVPIYYSTKTRNEVKVPVVVHHKKNMYRNVSGELSTILGATVSFDLDGKLNVKTEVVEGMSDEESSPKTKNLKKKAKDQAGSPHVKKVKKEKKEEVDDEPDIEESDNEDSINEENSEDQNASSEESSAEEEEVIKKPFVQRNTKKENLKSKANKKGDKTIKPLKKTVNKTPVKEDNKGANKTKIPKQKDNILKIKTNKVQLKKKVQNKKPSNK